MTKANKLSNLMALVLAASLLFPTSAFAWSYPFVDNVEDWGTKKVILTVTATTDGGAVQFKVTNLKTHKSKKPKARKCAECGAKHICVTTIKRNTPYKISVRSKQHGKWTKWRSIGYRFYG